MESVLDNCLTPTNEMILDLIEIETSLINTNHPDFIGSADSLLNLFQEQEPSKSDDEAPRTFSLLNKDKPEPVESPPKKEPEKRLNESTQSVKPEKESKQDAKAEPRPSRSWIPSFWQKGQDKDAPAQEPEQEAKEERKVSFTKIT